jgi:hypothetical protein
MGRGQEIGEKRRPFEEEETQERPVASPRSRFIDAGHVLVGHSLPALL